MNSYFVAAILTGVIGLAGCASTAETEAHQEYRADRQAGKETLTGSRLVKPTTERLVTSVGNAEYSELNQHTGIANRILKPSE